MPRAIVTVDGRAKSTEKDPVTAQVEMKGMSGAEPRTERGSSALSASSPMHKAKSIRFTGNDDDEAPDGVQFSANPMMQQAAGGSDDKSPASGMDLL